MRRHRVQAQAQYQNKQNFVKESHFFHFNRFQQIAVKDNS